MLRAGGVAPWGVMADREVRLPVKLVVLCVVCRATHGQPVRFSPGSPTRFGVRSGYDPCVPKYDRTRQSRTKHGPERARDTTCEPGLLIPWVTLVLTKAASAMLRWMVTSAPTFLRAADSTFWFRLHHRFRLTGRPNSVVDPKRVSSSVQCHCEPALL